MAEIRTLQIHILTCPCSQIIFFFSDRPNFAMVKSCSKKHTAKNEDGFWMGIVNNRPSGQRECAKGHRFKSQQWQYVAFSF
jgi:hypothetical protein